MSNLATKLSNQIIKLDLGCGIRNRKQPESEWIHLDIQDIAGIDIVADFANLEMFGNESVDEIYAGDVIEHIEPFNLDAVLKEWNRVLKPKGIFRLQTPNLHATMMRYVNKELSLEHAYGALYGSNENIYQHHFQTFTVDTLRDKLIEHGFGEIDFSESPCSGGDPRNGHWIVCVCKKINYI